MRGEFIAVILIVASAVGVTFAMTIVGLFFL